MTNTGKPGKETLKQWHNDPANWKCGIFYYNKNDKRIFPPKRSKLGWTVNFADPLSMLSLLLTTAILILLYRLIFE